ncbi:LysR family transcriptional regulator [Vibrio sp. T187]|uniref:LysR family transcriptional regulator n=1 Tax=Vibrio TaxID=662 RepID=UPI0010C95C7E|nr:MULTISPECIES: LysR family transcriptional regulator [Vibrio]MBW3698280.1 LysR family transcriptional regulator [Vibrio sp. T187]
MTNLEHLHVIETICAEGSFQKASEKLHKVRSAVSYSVKQMEAHYGVQIFTRDTYRPELTAEGKLLIVQIRRLLQQATEFETFVKEMKGEVESELRLGVGSLFPIEKITSLLLALKQRYPTTTIHLDIEVASGERRLIEENVDIAIYGSPSRNSAVDYQVIDTINIPLVISKTLLTDGQSTLTESELSRFPQVIMKSSDQQAPDTGIMDDALKWYVTDLTTKKSLINSGLGWGRMPYHLVDTEIETGALVVLDTYGELDLPIYVAKLKSKPIGPVAKAIWEYFQ